MMRVLQKNWPAVLPQEPNVSTTNGAHFHPNSEQIVSLHVCFLSPVCLAAAPATTPTSDEMFDISGEVMDTSMAAGLSLLDQLGVSISAGLLVSFHDPNLHLLGVLGSEGFACKNQK